MPISSEGLEVTQAVIALGLLGLSVPALAAAYVAAWRALTPRTRGWVAGATVAGALARWVVAPPLLAMIFIGYKQTEHALTLLPLSHYGVGATALYHAVFGFVPAPDHRTIQAVNSVLGVLTLPLVGALGARLWASGKAGALAAGFVALTPLFVRNDGSEANHVPTILWLTGGLVLLDAWAVDRRRLALLAAVPLLALAAMARPEMPLVLAALVPAVAHVSGVGWTRLREGRWALLAAAAVTVALATPHILHTLNAVTVLEGRASLPGLTLSDLPDLPRLLLERNVVLRPSLYPAGLALCAALTLFLRPRAWSLFAALVLVLALYVVDLDEANIARVHVLGALVATWLAAGGLAALAERLPASVAPAVLVLVLTAILVSAWPTATRLWAPANEHTEEALLAEAAAAVDRAQPFTLVRLGELDRRRGHPDSRFTHYHFPDYWFRPPAADGVVRSVQGFLDDPDPPGVPVYFFHGMRCYADFRSPDRPRPAGADLHPACAALHERHVLEPVFRRRVPNHGDVWIRYYGAAPELEVGLYRVTGPR